MYIPCICAILLILLLLVLCTERPENFEKTISEPDKIILLGSAPYMKAWVADNLQGFVDQGYAVVAVNNAWRLVPDLSKVIWHSSNEHNHRGTYVPTQKELDQFRKRVIHQDTDACIQLYAGKNTTMFFNTLYHYVFYGVKDVVVVGCDMMYTKSGDTFYSNKPGHKAQNDPLVRLGDENLNKECRHSYEMCKKYNINIRNASRAKSRLPYPRLTQYSKYALLLMTHNTPERMRMYEDVLNWWLDNSSMFDIYVVDSNNHPFSKDLEERCNVLHFDQNDFRLLLEKTGQTFDLSRYALVLHLTAKYKLPTLEESLRKLNTSPDYVVQNTYHGDLQSCELFGIKGRLYDTIQALKSYPDELSGGLHPDRLPPLENLARYPRADGVTLKNI